MYVIYVHIYDGCYVQFEQLFWIKFFFLETITIKPANLFHKSKFDKNKFNSGILLVYDIHNE